MYRVYVDNRMVAEFGSKQAAVDEADTLYAMADATEVRVYRVERRDGANILYPVHTCTTV